MKQTTLTIFTFLTLAATSCVVGSEAQPDCSWDDWWDGKCIVTYDTDGPEPETNPVPFDPCVEFTLDAVTLVASGGAQLHNYAPVEPLPFVANGDGHGWAVPTYPLQTSWLAAPAPGSSGWPLHEKYFGWSTPHPDVEIGPGQTLVVWHWMLTLPTGEVLVDGYHKATALADLGVGALIMTDFGPGELPASGISWYGELGDLRPMGTPVASETLLSHAGPGDSGWWPVLRGAWAWEASSGWCLVEHATADDGGDL